MVGRQQVQAKYRSKTDLVAAAIKEMIYSGDLPPGAVLRQRDIAELLGVSPTPVREAIRRLEGGGLLVSQSHGRMVVVRAEDWALRDNAQIRAALESLGTELAADKATEEDLAALEVINEEFIGSLGNHAINLNRHFHVRIYEIAASSVLQAQLRLLWETLDGGPHVERLPIESGAQHQEIIEAMRNRDVPRAGALVRHHILDAVPEHPHLGALGQHS